MRDLTITEKITIKSINPNKVDALINAWPYGKKGKEVPKPLAFGVLSVYKPFQALYIFSRAVEQYIRDGAVKEVTQWKDAESVGAAYLAKVYIDSLYVDSLNCFKYITEDRSLSSKERKNELLKRVRRRFYNELFQIIVLDLEAEKVQKYGREFNLEGWSLDILEKQEHRAEFRKLDSSYLSGMEDCSVHLLKAYILNYIEEQSK